MHAYTQQNSNESLVLDYIASQYRTHHIAPTCADLVSSLHFYRQASNEEVHDAKQTFSDHALNSVINTSYYLAIIELGTQYDKADISRIAKKCASRISQIRETRGGHPGFPVG